MYSQRKLKRHQIKMNLQTFAAPAITAETAILRAGTTSLIPEEQTRTIIQGAIAQSAVLNLMTRLPNMGSSVQTMPVLSLLPMAYFVNGDTGLKQTTKMAWDQKKIYAEEIAVIVPVPDAVLDDARSNGYDIWGEVTPRVQEAFGKAIDAAILFGVDKPSTWRKSVLETAKDAGAIVTSTGDLFVDIFGENGVESKVEESGYLPNVNLARVGMRAKLRGLRDANNNPLYMTSIQEGVPNYALDGVPTAFQTNGAWDPKVDLIMGDFSQAVYAIRQDLTVKVLTESVITDSSGNIIYNLPQQDMTALRFVLRMGWEIPNPINSLQPNETLRTPFAVYANQAIQ